VRIAGAGSDVYGVVAVSGSDTAAASLLVARRRVSPRWVSIADVAETVDVPGWH
jgi:hypothetical protein